MVARRFRSLLLLVLIAAAADARMRGPIGLRMDLRLDSQDEKLGTKIVLRVHDRDRPCVVTHATVMRGNALAADIFDLRRPYKPTFVLRGPKDLLAKFEDAKADDVLRVTGNWQPGTSNFLVGAIGPATD